MKPTKVPPTPKRHTIAYRPGTLVKEAYCTTCGKDLDYRDVNKRCKGAKK